MERTCNNCKHYKVIWVNRAPKDRRCTKHDFSVSGLDVDGYGCNTFRASKIIMSKLAKEEKLNTLKEEINFRKVD